MQGGCYLNRVLRTVVLMTGQKGVSLGRSGQYCAKQQEQGVIKPLRQN